MVHVTKIAHVRLKGILQAPELEGSSKNKSDELMDTNEGKKTYMRDMTKPVGDACRDDGTLKDANELEWPESPSEIVTQQEYFDHWPEPHHPEGDFDGRSPTPLEVLSVVDLEPEDEKTIPQKRKKVSMRVCFWSKWYSQSF